MAWDSFDPDPAATHDPASGVVVPVTWLDLINAEFAALGDAWGTNSLWPWLSSGTAPAIGNGSCVAGFHLIGKTLYFRMHMVCGSTTTFGTGDYFWTLPTDAVAGVEQVIPGKLVDNSTGTNYAVTGYVLSGAGIFHAVVDGATGNVGAAAPFTWAQDDYITFNGVIEVA